MRNSPLKVRFRNQHRVHSADSVSTRGPSRKEKMAQRMDMPSAVPAYQLSPSPLQDTYSTQTSRVQDETVDECLPLLEAFRNPSRSPFEFNSCGLPALEKEDHAAFLHENLEDFPAQFVGIDASRPWMVYWGLLGLYLLGEDVTRMRSRVLSTFYPLQNPNGGFGGGHGHYSHLAATYAALLSIALVGGDDNYSMIDRKAMWHWLGRLKQANGGFQICEGGEEDARGAYCALVVTSLLALPIELPPDSPARQTGMSTFNDGLGEYLSRCQSYEGGISAGPGNEAHGAYAFCAISCFCLLGVPQTTMKEYLDMDALIAWLSARQYAPEGGFAGRTNKLVDGCYSHWIGGCWPLVQAALHGALFKGPEESEEELGNLYSGEGLTRYILCCCQAPNGGLRDKPSKRPDSYHTCYTLVGVSNVEHFHYYQEKDESNQFGSAFSWKAVKVKSAAVRLKDDGFEDGTDLQALHPVYAIPHESVSAIRAWSDGRAL